MSEAAPGVSPWTTDESSDGAWAEALGLYALLALMGGVLVYAFALPLERPGRLVAFTLGVGGAWYLAWRWASVPMALAAGVGMRLCTLAAAPQLSDDFYRFLWDGELWLAGYHPLAFVPAEAPSAFAKTHARLLAEMNSPGYFTVYPPLAQLVFAAAAWLTDALRTGAAFLQASMLAAEVGVLALLHQLDRSPGQRGLVAYALLPLPIVECVGNAHFESLAVFGLLYAILQLRRAYASSAGSWLGVGFLAKLLPALGGPALLAALWRRRAADTAARERRWAELGRFLLGAALVAVAGLVLFALPLLREPGLLAGFGDSLDLYFRRFEFNGSAYAVARELGIAVKGWNWIAVVGPSLALLSLATVVTLAAQVARGRLPLAEALLWSFGAYLLFATTVHPWYAVYCAALAPLTRYRWPYALAFAIILSYAAYGYDPVALPAWLTVLEYVPVLALAAWEARRGGSGARAASLRPRG